MPKPRIPSPSRSQGTTTPRRNKPRRSRSVCSPALSNASGRLTSVIDQFKENNMESFTISPMKSRWSVLTDNTDIDEPRRKSWWKNLNENSQDFMEVLEDNKTDSNNSIGDISDIEVVSQENKNFSSLDLPESSDNESIHSIVLTQRKLFTQKEKKAQKKFDQLIDARDKLTKLHKSNTTFHDKTITAGTKDLFQGTKKSKTIFPALLDISTNNKTTLDKTVENVVAEPKVPVKNIFGNRPAKKRKNIFADFIVSDSEHEVSDIQVQAKQSLLKRKKNDKTEDQVDDGKKMEVSLNLQEMVRQKYNASRHVGDDNQDSDQRRVDQDFESDKSNFESKDEKENENNQSNVLTNKSTVKEKTMANVANTGIGLDNDDITSEKSDTESNGSLKLTYDSEEHQEIEENINANKTVATDAISEQDEQEKMEVDNFDITKSTEKISSNSSIQPNKTLELDYNSKVLEKIDETVDADEAIGANEIPEQDDKDEMAVDNYEIEKNTSVDKQKSNLLVADKTVENKEDNDENEVNAEHDSEIIDTDQHEQTIVNNDQVKENEANTDHEQSGFDKDQNEDNEVDENEGNEVEDDKSQENEVDNHEIEKDAKLKESELDDDENKEVDNDEMEVAELDESQLDINEKGENEVDSDKNEEVVGENEIEVDAELDESQLDSNEKEENEVENDKNEEDVGENETEVDAELDENQLDNNEKEENEVNSDKNAEKVSENEIEVGAELDENQLDDNETEDNEVDSDQNEEEVGENEIEVDAELDESQSDSDENEENALDNDESVVSEVENEDNEIEKEENEEEVEHEESEVDYEEDEVENSENDIDDEHEQSKVENDQMEETELDSDDNEDTGVGDDDNAIEDENDDENQEHPSRVISSDEVIEESPDVTHDTTGRNRKRVKSPEVALHDKTKQQTSFIAKGRNTSIRETKTMYKDLNIRPSMAPPRDSLGLSDGDSSAEGSGWDSHRTTRKTLRQTFGKDFTPRKSLRALVMEKSAKRTTNVPQSESVLLPQANSTEYPQDSHSEVDVSMASDHVTMESDHEVSRRTRQTTLETYLQKMKQQNLEKKLKMEQAIRESLKAPPTRDSFSLFKVPSKPPPRRPKPTTNKPKKQLKSALFEELPSEVIEDMKYKPPKRFQPSNASWITKRLYKFLETKLEPKYDYKARVRAEKLVETIYHFAKDLRRHNVAPVDAVDVLKHELARLEVVKTHFEFYEFFHEFMPREVRVKVVPDIVNKIPLPRHGVFADILRGNTVQG